MAAKLARGRAFYLTVARVEDPMVRLMLVALALVLVLPAASASSGSEFKILDAYLGTFDVASGTPHCARYGGPAEPSDVPRLPVDHFNGTNRLLDDHIAWHTRQTRMATRADANDDNNTFGDEFVMMHRMMIGAYDDWRAAHGDPPIPVWDPAGPLPEGEAYDVPDACLPRNAEIKTVPLPTWLTLEGGSQKDPLFNYTSLCEFPTMNRLGKSIDPGAAEDNAVEIAATPGPTSYHSDGHAAVGGDMRNPDVSMRDPLFWAWHKHIDQRVRLWESACGHADSMAGMSMGAASAPAAGERAVPAPALGVLALAALAAALSRRRA